jgi:hypothetical protein
MSLIFTWRPSSLSAAQMQTVKMPVFGLAVPVSCPGVEASYLDPRSTWSNGHAYDAKLASLAREFDTNFTKYDWSRPLCSPAIRLKMMLIRGVTVFHFLQCHAGSTSAPTLKRRAARAVHSCTRRITREHAGRAYKLVTRYKNKRYKKEYRDKCQKCLEEMTTSCSCAEMLDFVKTSARAASKNLAPLRSWWRVSNLTHIHSTI